MINFFKEAILGYKLVNNFKKKNFGENWKAGIEANLLQLQMSGKSVVEPQRDSSIIYTCLKIISQNFASVPVKILKNDKPIVDPGDKVISFFDNHDYEFWEKVSLLFSLRGEVFLYIAPSLGQRAGVSTLPAELVALDGKYIKELRNDKRVLVGWRWNDKLNLSLDEVIHIKNFNTVNPDRGLSPILALQMTLDTDKFAEEYNKKFFDNAAMPSGILSLGEEQDDSPEEMKKLLAMWNAEHAGVSNSRKTGVLKYGMKYEPIALTQQEMDFINSRQYTRNQIISAMGVPEPLVNFDAKGVYDTIVPALRTFWSQTIKPIADRLEQKFNHSFFPRFAPEYKIVYDFGNVVELQDDYSKRTEQAIKLQMLGYNRNEINKILNLGFEHDPDGDIKYIPANLLPETDMNEPVPEFDDVNEEPDETDEIVDDEKHFNNKIDKNIRKRRFALEFRRKHQQLEKLFHSKLKSYFFKQRSTILEQLANLNKSVSNEFLIYNGINIIDAETKRLVELMIPLYTQAATVGGEMALIQLGLDRDYILNNTIVQRRANLITGVVRTIFNQIKMQINEGINNGETMDDITLRVKSVYNTTSSRSRLIARTEVTEMLNESAVEEYKNNNVEMKEWLTAGDENVRDNCRMAEQQGPIPIDKDFHHGLQHPSEPNCRCAVIPVINN